MDTAQLPDLAALDDALRAPRFLLFKHSPRCGASRWAFDEFRAFAAAHPDVPHGYVLVRKQRELSDWITETTGVPHASPQAIWIVDGAPAWNASHHEISRGRLARLLAESPPPEGDAVR